MMSPGGRSSTSSVSLAKSTAVLTIQMSQAAMNAFNRDEAGSASGEIPGSAASISVNGVAATTTYNSGLNKTSWSASGIPGNEDGWMELVATAVPSSGAPITAKLEFEKPPLLRLKERHLDTTITAAGFPWEVPPHHEELHYKRKRGGYYTGTTLWTDSGCSLHWEWTADDVFTNYSKYCDDVLQNGAWYSAPPHNFDELTQEYQEVQDGDHFYTYSRTMKQELELRAGGKPDPGREDLVIFSVGALAQGYGFNNDVNPPFFATNAGYVANSAIHLWGQTADASGKIYAQVVPSSKTPATPKFDVNDVQPTVGVTQSKLQILRGGDITDKTSPAIVGQNISLQVALSNYPLTDIQWTIPGNTISNYLWGATYSYVYTDYVKTNASVAFYWIDGGKNLEVTCTAKYNGQAYSAKTTFNVIRPLPSFSAQIRDQVQVGTGFRTTSSPSDPNPYLQFGPNTNAASCGIAFSYSGAPTIANTTNTYGSYALVQVIESWRQQYNLLDAAGLCNGYQFDRWEGLDTALPYGRISTSINLAEPWTMDWTDSPGAQLSSAEWLSQTASFSTFLMFSNRFGGIYVPMYKVSWSYSGSATNHPWGKKSGSESCGAPTLTTEFPRWTNLISGVNTFPTNTTPTNCFQ